MTSPPTVARRRRILLALLLPIAALLVFTGYVLTEKLVIYNHNTSLSEVADLVKATSRLVHELQRERGRSALHLGASDDRHLPDLRAQWEATDGQREALTTAVDRLTAKHTLEDDSLDMVRRELAAIDARRARIETREMPSTAAIDAYTQGIADILLGAGRLPHSDELPAAIAAYSDLVRLKENLGQERAIGSAGFAQGHFSYALFVRHAATRARQEAYTESFERHANAEQRRVLAHAIEPELAEEVSRMRAQATESFLLNREVDIDGSRWFVLMTRMIDRLRLVEDKLAADIDNLVADRLAGARQTLVVVALGVVALVLMSVGALLRSELGAQQAREQLAQAIENVSDGFALWSPDARLVICNETFRELFLSLNPTAAAQLDQLLLPGVQLAELVAAAVAGNSPGRDEKWARTRLDPWRHLKGEGHECLFGGDRWLRISAYTSGDGTVGIYTDITELKRKNLALAASEERLAQIIDNVADGIVVIGEDGRVQAINAAGQGILRIGEAEAVGRPVDRLIPGFAIPAEPGQAEHGRFAFFEIDSRRGDGAPMIIEAGISRLKLAAERLAIAIIRDVTERRRIEEQLRKLHRAVEQSPVSVIITDPGGRIEYVNASFTRTSGYELEEVAGKTPSVLKSGQNDDHIYKELWITITSGREWRGELCNRRKSGESYWEEVTISPVHGPRGEVVNYVALKQDITELKALKSALEIEHENTLRILEAMNDGICVLTADGTIEFFNPALEAEFGPAGKGACCAEYFGSLPGPCDGDRKTTRLEWQSPLNGKVYDVTDTPVLTRDGRHRRLKVFHDITTRKRAEQALRDAHHAAEIANRAKTEFLANMSHELRTPLNAIIGFSDVMCHQILGPVGNDSYAGYVVDINQAGVHLLDLVNDILDISKIEAGNSPIAEEDFALAPVVEASLKMVRERASKGELRLAADVPEDLPGLRADRRRVKQIIVNLLSNAVKFTPPGGTVKLAAEVRDGGIAVAISDTGIGIAPEDIPRALAPFGQVDTSLARRYEGTGLGLPLSKSLMEIHGGSLEIDSEPGRGTKVTILFPASRSILAPTGAKATEPVA